MSDPVTAAGISAGGSIIGGLLGGSGSKEAAKTQEQAGQSAIAEQQREFDIGQKSLAPYQAVGQQALYTLSDYLGLPSTGTAWQPGMPTPKGAMSLNEWAQKQGYSMPSGRDWFQSELSQLTPGYQSYLASIPQQTTFDPNTGSLLKPFSFDISQDPGYQFRLQQGEQAITNRASATGGVSGGGDLSGATLKELLRYGQDYASGEYQNAFARDQATKAQQYGFLTGAAGMGQGATTTGVQAGQAFGANVGNTITGIGNAQAAGQVGQANALSGAFGNIGSTVSQAAMLKQIFGNQGVNQVNQGVNLGSSLDPSAFAG